MTRGVDDCDHELKKSNANSMKSQVSGVCSRRPQRRKWRNKTTTPLTLDVSNFQRAISMVIPRSRSAFNLSRTQAYLNDPAKHGVMKIFRQLSCPQRHSIRPRRKQEQQKHETGERMIERTFTHFVRLLFATIPQPP